MVLQKSISFMQNKHSKPRAMYTNFSKHHEFDLGFRVSVIYLWQIAPYATLHNTRELG